MSDCEPGLWSAAKAAADAVSNLPLTDALAALAMAQVSVEAELASRQQG